MLFHLIYKKLKTWGLRTIISPFYKCDGEAWRNLVHIFQGHVSLLFSHSVFSNSLPPHEMQHQASLSFTISWRMLKLIFIELVMPSNYLVFYCPFLLLPSIFPRIRVFSMWVTLRIRWPMYWSFSFSISSVQFSSVTQSCPTLWDPMSLSMPGLSVQHQLLEFAQTHVHWVSDAIQPSHRLSSPSPPAPNPSHIRVFSSESTLCMR